MEDIITIVGPRAAGKSTIGRQLAHQTGYRYVDFDEILQKELESEGGIFAFSEKHGWHAFMKRFHYCLKGFLANFKNEKIILDLGGGSIAAPEFPEAELNAKLILENARKIFLILPHLEDDKNIEALFRRERERGVPYAKDWPDEKLKEKIAKDYLERVPIFRKYAHHQFFNEDKSPKEVAEIIMRQM